MWSRPQPLSTLADGALTRSNHVHVSKPQTHNPDQGVVGSRGSRQRQGRGIYIYATIIILFLGIKPEVFLTGKQEAPLVLQLSVLVNKLSAIGGVACVHEMQKHNKTPLLFPPTMLRICIYKKSPLNVKPRKVKKMVYKQEMPKKLSKMANKKTFEN